MIETDALDALHAAFSGELVTPDHPEYDEARRVFNAMVDRRPAVIVRCTSTADVVAAVRFGREFHLAVAVRCGGHSVSGLGVCDDGIVIDLCGLKRIDVDPVGRTAQVGGNVLWGEFDAATQAHALHTPGVASRRPASAASRPAAATAGRPRSSAACDNLISAEVVLADGSVRASEDENEDLFWGIRGGGGNFGVVTEFESGLHGLGPIVLAGLMARPIDRTAEIVRAWRDYVDAAPDELGSAVAVVTAPPEEFVPDHLKGRAVIGLIAIYVGDPEQGAPVVQPFRDLAPEVDLVGPMPYTAFQAMIDPLAPPGLRSYWRGEYLTLSRKAIDTFVERGIEVQEEAAPLSQMIVFRIGQGVTAVPDDASAFSHRGAGHLFHPISVWQSVADDERVIAANRAFAEAMRAFGTGAAYLNFTPEAGRVRDAYGAEKYERLVALKDEYDPHNLFRLNQNIRPSAQAGEPVPAWGAVRRRPE